MNASTGAFTYDPTNVAAFETIQVGTTAIDTFTYTVTDNHGASSTATVTVDVSVTDAGPSATGFTTSTDEDTPILNGSVAANVTAGEPGDTGDTLTYTATNAASGAVVSMNASTGAFTYDPTNVAAFETIQVGTTAIDTFTYTVTDNHGASSTATVTVDVSVTDAGPSATGFTTSTDEDTPILNGSVAANVTAGEPGDTGDTLTYTATNAASGAVVSMNASTGAFTYDPTNVAAFETIQVGTTAIDTFTYTVTDNHGASSTATVTVDVSVTDAGPSATGFTTSTDEDTPILNGSVAANVTAGEPGDTGDTLTYTATNAASGAVVSMNASTGAFTYDPTNVAAFETMPGRHHRDRHLHLHRHRQPRRSSSTATVTVDVSSPMPARARTGRHRQHRRRHADPQRSASPPTSPPSDARRHRSATLTDYGHRCDQRARRQSSRCNASTGAFTYDPTNAAAFETHARSAPPRSTPSPTPSPTTTAPARPPPSPSTSRHRCRPERHRFHHQHRRRHADPQRQRRRQRHRRRARRHRRHADLYGHQCRVRRSRLDERQHRRLHL